MAEKRVAYESLKVSVARRVSELNSLVDKPDKVERAVRGKVNNLEADKIKLIRGAAEYVESLADDTEKEEVYKEQPELVDKIDQALEKAMEYLREEEDKTEILEKASEVLNKGKKIKRSLEIVEEKVNEFEPPEKLMPGSIRETLEAELVKVETEMDILTKDYQYLISHDLSKKEGYEENMLELETHSGKILDIRLAMGTKSDQKPKEVKDSSFMLPKLETVSVMPPQENYVMPTIIPNNEVVKSASAVDVGAVGGAVQSATSDQAIQPGPTQYQGAQQYVGQRPQVGSSFPKIQMQKLKAPTFNGDVCCYAGWKKQWREMVHPNCSGDSEELYRMQDAMETKNLKLVLKSFQSLADAWDYLNDKFGRADVAAVKMMNEFKSMDFGKVGDHEKFMTLHEKFKNLATNMNEIGQLSALNSLTEVNLIISMLPGEVKTEFAKFKSSHKSLSGYSLLAEFMDYQVIISRECVVAEQAVGSKSLGAGGSRPSLKKDIRCYK